MSVAISTRNASGRKAWCRRDVLGRLAERICEGEDVKGNVEISVLYCDDAFIAGLNQEYLGKRGPTDVLSFSQAAGPVNNTCALGDIVISLETVEGRCNNEAECREEVKLLFCHGMLHLLGYDHQTKSDERLMREKQARYLDIVPEAAWRYGRSQAKAKGRPT
jgi:probable rRNA maturation factor